GLVLTLGDVLFDFNRAELKPAANRTALKLVQFLQLNPRRVIRIEGYTDSVGDRQANLDLSRERAQAVADVLADLGVDPARMQVVGYGEAFPVTDNGLVLTLGDVLFDFNRAELKPAANRTALKLVQFL
ncbi:OmpA family protein, partial [Escherichia coli]